MNIRPMHNNNDNTNKKTKKAVFTEHLSQVISNGETTPSVSLKDSAWAQEGISQLTKVSCDLCNISVQELQSSYIFVLV